MQEAERREAVPLLPQFQIDLSDLNSHVRFAKSEYLHGTQII
jgi:hypothetical protein